MIELERDNLQEIVNSNQKVIVQYGASWCGNCRIVKPKFRKLSESNKNIEFVYVDAEKLPESRKMANVSNLPTFAGFHNGKLILEKQGNKIELVEQILSEI